MAIPSDTCAQCCICPTPAVEWDSRSASLTKVGFFYSDSTQPHLRVDWGGSDSYVNNSPLCGGTGPGLSGGRTASGYSTTDGFANITFCSLATTDTPTPGTPVSGCTGFGQYEALPSFGHARTTYSADKAYYQFTECSGTLRWVSDIRNDLSGPYTTALLKTNTVSLLAAYDGDWNDTAGSFANLSADELSYAIRESRYRLRFKIPTVNTGLNYRAFWVERFIAEAGVGITSVEVYSRGVYRPTVTLSAPPAGGTQALSVAVMSSTGTVTSILILNPGAGYTSAPTVTVQAATGGGTSSTGWTATLTGSQVTAIASGSAGNYLPTLAFSGGGGTGATATCTMDAQGGIDAVTIGASGSGYTSAPTLAITAKVTGSTAADLLLHLGTETARCAVWDGVTPGGYNPATPSTYPILGDGVNPYFELPVPAADGTTLVANLRAVCDGSVC